jgi:hypothetical protein
MLWFRKCCLGTNKSFQTDMLNFLNDVFSCKIVLRTSVRPWTEMANTLKYKHSHLHVTLEIHALAGWLSPVLGWSRQALTSILEGFGLTAHIPTTHERHLDVHCVNDNWTAGGCDNGNFCCKRYGIPMVLTLLFQEFHWNPTSQCALGSLVHHSLMLRCDIPSKDL